MRGRREDAHRHPRNGGNAATVALKEQTYRYILFYGGFMLYTKLGRVFCFFLFMSVKSVFKKSKVKKGEIKKM